MGESGQAFLRFLYLSVEKKGRRASRIAAKLHSAAWNIGDATPRMQAFRARRARNDKNSVF
jgi:hypothetical protein